MITKKRAQSDNNPKKSKRLRLGKETLKDLRTKGKGPLAGVARTDTLGFTCSCYNCP